VILPGIKIEGDGMVAAAAVVTKDVPEATIVLGSPPATSAKFRKHNY